jgi:quercetin dioxygenase-like cupin family protein
MKTEVIEQAAEIVFATSDKASFKEVVKGVSKATLWENPENRSYGAFTRFVPGLDSGRHTHTHDTWLVVLRGAYLYKDQAGEKRVGPGHFIRIPGGHVHWSGGDPKEGALFYEEGQGEFDLIPVK